MPFELCDHGLARLVLVVGLDVDELDQLFDVTLVPADPPSASPPTEGPT